DLRAQRRASGDRRPAAEAGLAGALRIGVGNVARVGDVDRDRDVRTERVRGRARAGEVSDLLADRRDGDHVTGCASRLRDAPRDLGGDEAADAVVEGARGDTVVRKLLRLADEHRTV